MFTAEIINMVAHPLSAISALTMTAFIPAIAALLAATIAADRIA